MPTQKNPFPAHLEYRSQPHTRDGKFVRVDGPDTRRRRHPQPDKTKQHAGRRLSKLWPDLENQVARALHHSFDLDLLFLALGYLQKQLVDIRPEHMEFEALQRRELYRDILRRLLMSPPDKRWRSISYEDWRQGLQHKKYNRKGENWRTEEARLINAGHFTPNTYERMLDVALGILIRDQVWHSRDLDDAMNLVDLLEQRHNLGLPHLTRKWPLNSIPEPKEPARPYNSLCLPMGSTLCPYSGWPFDWVNVKDFGLLFGYMVGKKSYLLEETLPDLPKFISAFLCDGTWGGHPKLNKSQFARAESPSVNLPGQVLHHLELLVRTGPEAIRAIAGHAMDNVVALNQRQQAHVSRLKAEAQEAEALLEQTWAYHPDKS